MMANAGSDGPVQSASRFLGSDGDRFPTATAQAVERVWYGIREAARSGSGGSVAGDIRSSEEGPVSRHPPSPPPVVQVRDVTKTFGKVRALDSVSLAFEPGIVYALLGPNGAGKTTLIRILTTLLVPDAGQVVVAGFDVLANPVAARAQVGLAGQFAALDDYLTGRENVAMIGRLYGLAVAEARRRTDDILERIGLTDAADRRIGTYSGGMRRRLDLAASLVGRPQVMFLDEPTTGIDPRSRINLWELVEELVATGTTVLLTTQYLEEADRLADRIGVIHDGRIITEGTADELKDTFGGAVLELAVRDDERSEVMETLARVTGEEPVFDPGRTRIRVPARDGPRTLMAAVRALDAAGLEPSDIALHKPTLDDVFLALTGDHPPTADGEAQRSHGHRKGSTP
ncbi:MAG: ATP-binding cassette domain-containing protein [Nitriliruptorales bacterium]